jgi:hypothetical protein
MNDEFGYTLHMTPTTEMFMIFKPQLVEQAEYKSPK